MENYFPVSTTIAAIIEKSLNMALRYDPGTRTKLQTLDGCSLNLHCHSPELKLHFTLKDTEVSVLSHADKSADVTITGPALDFLALMGEPTHSLANSEIEIAGKIAVLNQIKAALADIDIDWEEPLSEIIGIVPAHWLANHMKTSGHWLLDRKKHFEDNIADYLSEELKATPSTPELHAFFEQVDTLNADTQRLQARLQRLLNTQHSHTNKK